MIILVSIRCKIKESKYPRSSQQYLASIRQYLVTVLISSIFQPFLGAKNVIFPSVFAP